MFKALADPTRRALLDALFAADGQTVNALCAAFPEMTRFGVMKHLAVLEAADLVVTHRSGRTKLHYLNPVPIQRDRRPLDQQVRRMPVHRRAARTCAPSSSAPTA